MIQTKKGPGQKVDQSKELYVVAIGASAGGLEAINEFFDNMPVNPHMAFIIIQHLSPQHKSLLVELIGKHTLMKVAEAVHEQTVEAGYIYVIPNNKVITIRKGKLSLEDKSFVKAPNTAIDIFLKSLAEDQKEKSIGIVLSGTGTDGSRGIQDIKNAGGMVMVQDPVSAQFDGMPNSSIATGYIDFILPPELMPEEIFNYIRKEPSKQKINESQPGEEDLPRVIKLIDKHCHQDFFNYKPGTLLRRITRRMASLGINYFSDYYKLLEKSPEECRFLSKDFLIGVTRFFRDNAAFESLQRQVLEPMIEQKQDGDGLKVWVTACSTGQEVYSIAILLNELLEKHDKKLELKFFATDMDSEAIEFASKGSYDSMAMEEVPARLREKYFLTEEKNCVVQPFLRKQIVFARHNVIKDPPFIKNDLVTCRNMLIYMETSLQQKVMSTLEFALNPGGYLFLGPSEVVGADHAFETVDIKWKIYKKTNSNSVFKPEHIPTVQPGHRIRIPEKIKKSSLLDELFKSTLVDHYGFAAVTIDKNYELKEAIGDYKKYLSLPDGSFSLNVLKMVSSELSVSLAAAVRKALKNNEEVSIQQLLINNDSDKILVFIRPLPVNNQVMLLFSRAENMGIVNGEITTVQEVDLAYVKELQEELKESRSNLQLAIESLESANEELQSSNEELLSANEELQSSNEELQSLNEELHTLNTEHQLRIRELIELNDDLDNYFRSTDMAQVFVDDDLRIRKFNPAAQQIINLIEGDIGRNILHISNNFADVPNLAEEISQVIRSKQFSEKEVHLKNKSIFILRIFPFLRKDRSVDGAVVTLYDITRQKELNTIVKAVYNATLSAKLAFKAQRNNKGEVKEFELLSANAAAQLWLGNNPEKLKGKTARNIFPVLYSSNLFNNAVEVLHSGEPFREEIFIEKGNPSGWFDVAITQMLEGIVFTVQDINEKKKSEERFRQNYQELMNTKERLRQLNQELEKNVLQRTLELSQSEERFRIVASSTSDAIYDRNLVNNTMWWSESFYKWLGYENTGDTLRPAFWLNLIHPDDVRNVKSLWQLMLQEGQEWHQVYRLKKSNGSYVTVEDNGKLLINENGIPYRLIGTLRDMSAAELEQQNRALQINNQQLENLVQQRTLDLEAQKTILQDLFMRAPAMISILRGKDLVFELANPLYQKLYNNRPLLGLSIWEAIPELKDKPIARVIQHVYESGEIFVGNEFKMEQSAGNGKESTEIYCNFIFQPAYDENGKVDGILVFAYEVTDQVVARRKIQEANEELQQLYREFQFVTDFIPQLVWSTQPDGYHDFYNRRWYEYTGLSYELTKGTGWNTVVHKDDQERAWQLWRHSLNTGEPYEIEYRFRRYDGQYRWFLGRALPIRDESGRINKWFGTCTDIHDQKMMHEILEQKVLERTEELENANSELTQFASIASHDLKEPLRKIVMFSNVLKEKHEQEMSKEAITYLQRIINSSTRMNQLVHDLLTFTRMTSGELQFDYLDLNDILSQVLSDLELTIDEKNAEVEVKDLPKVEMIPAQMRQVFQNLISNSLKFSRPDLSPHIRIWAEILSGPEFDSKPSSDGTFVKITIQDNGIGFENEYSDKIFTIFQRLNSKKDYDGTGIGLAIVKKIITNHNGIIRATGEEGKGARFEIVMPLRQE